MKKGDRRLLIGILILTSLVVSGIYLNLTKSDRLMDSAAHFVEAGKYQRAIELCTIAEKNLPKESFRIDLILRSAYLGWGKQNLAAGEFSDAKDHLLAAMGGEKSSSFSVEAEKELLNLTESWITSLKKDRKYEDAISLARKLEISEISRESVESARYLQCAIPQIYLDWGDWLSSDRKYKEAIEVFNQAETEISSCHDLDSQLIIQKKRTYVFFAEALMQDSKYEESIDLLKKCEFLQYPEVRDTLTKATDSLIQSKLDEKKYVDALAIVNELAGNSTDETERKLLNEKKDTILRELSVDTGSEGLKVIKTVGDLACKGESAKTNEFGTIISLNNAQKKAFLCNSTFTLANELTANSPSELKYAISVKESIRTLTTCSYNSGYSLTPEVTIWDILIYDVITGKVVDYTTLEGVSPNCPDTYSFQIGKHSEFLFGDSPTTVQVNNYLKTVIQ